MQPTKGNINGYKTNHHPKIFFTDLAISRKGDAVVGSKYISDYDFLSSKDSQGKIDFSDAVWESEKLFIAQRKELMLNFIKQKYGIRIAGSNDSESDGEETLEAAA